MHKWIIMLLDCKEMSLRGKRCAMSALCKRDVEWIKPKYYGMGMKKGIRKTEKKGKKDRRYV